MLRATNIQIENLRDLKDRPGNFAERAAELWASELGNPSGGAQIIAESIWELVSNALLHSESAIGCVVAGQVFPKKQEVEFAVLDLGQTIRGHLTRNPVYSSITSDEEAITRAMQLGVTGTVGLNKWNEPNSGAGLNYLQELCGQGGSQLTIISGDCGVTIGGVDKTPKIWKFHGGFRGCLVNFRACC